MGNFFEIMFFGGQKICQQFVAEERMESYESMFCTQLFFSFHKDSSYINRNYAIVW